MKRTILRFSCIAIAGVLTTNLRLVWATDPVCIVGAGPAGLTVANRLETKGYETVVFEKDLEVGGKCQSYYDEEAFFHPMGALFFMNDTYRETLPIIDASGLPTFPFSTSNNVNEWVFDSKSGHVQQMTSQSSLTKSPLLQAEIDRYIKFWNTEFAPLNVIGYKNGVKGYTMSTFDWLRANDYPLLLLLFIKGMVAYGYGDIMQVPAIYMLQHFNPNILLFIAGQKAAYMIDFHQVFVTYARSHIKGPIHINTTVTKIDRSGDLPVLSYNDPIHGQSTLTQKCNKLVLAFPPVMNALKAANLDVDQREATIFSPVRITKYWSGAVRVNTPFGDAFSGFLNQNLLGIITKIMGGLSSSTAFAEFMPWLPKATGGPVSYFRLFPGSDIASTWSWGSNQTFGEAKSLLKEVMSKLNKDPGSNAAPIPITDKDVRDFREWDYFPHFDGHELDNGIYESFNALQGYKNTYYVSGLNGFELVEFAVRAGQDVVDTYIL